MRWFVAILLIAVPAGAERILGTNLPDIKTSDVAMQFCDLMKESSSDWVRLSGTDATPTVSADGWITACTGADCSNVNTRWRAAFLIDTDHTDWPEYCDANGDVIVGATSGTRCPANFPRGEYTIDCAGGTAKVGIGRNATIDETFTCPGSKTFTVDAPLPDSQGLEGIIWSSPTVTGEPKIRVYPSGTNPAACNPDTDTFNPKFLYTIVRSKVKSTRFLSWQQVYIPSQFNQIIDWTDRPKLTYRTYVSDQATGPSSKGAPFELGVILANELLAKYGWTIRPWFMLPVRSSDDFHTNFAAYILANLNAAIPYSAFEWCNECWNFGGSYLAQRNQVLLDAQETNGAVASGTTTTVTVAGTPWGVNQFATMEVHVSDTSNNNTQDRKVITSNTNNTLTLSGALSFTPASPDTFRIYRYADGETNQIYKQQAERSAQVYEIYKASLGVNKIRRVLGIQNKEAANPSDANVYLNFDPFGALLTTDKYFDWVAIAPYLALSDGTLHGRLNQNALNASYGGVSNDQCGTDAAHITNTLTSGTATSGTTTTVVKTGANFTPSAFSSVSAQVCATDVSAGNAVSCSIATANTIDTITVSPAFSFDVDSPDTFRVEGTVEFACCGHTPKDCPGIRDWTPTQLCASMRGTIESQRLQMILHKTAVEAHTNLEGKQLRLVLYEGGPNHDDRTGGSTPNQTADNDEYLVKKDHAAHYADCFESLTFDYLNMLEGVTGPDVPLNMLVYIAKYGKFQQFGFAEYLFKADGRPATCMSPTMRGAINWANEGL